MTGVEQVFRTLLRGWRPRNRVLVALSGGADSMCLTYLLHKHRKLWNVEVSAVTIDHGYREGSDQEAMSIGRVVGKWGVDHHIVPLGVANVHDVSNFEEMARSKRYEIFSDLSQQLGSTDLFMGHNFDDQLETFVQRLRQNSTLFGLSGLKDLARLPVPPTGPIGTYPPVLIRRPMLAVDKKSIVEYCTENNIPWFEDRTNSDIHLTNRNLYRYMINDYIPRSQDLSLECVSRENLSTSFSRVRALVDSYDAAATRLYHNHQNHISMDPMNSTITLNLPYSILNHNDYVISRFLFKLMYPISAAHHYHWCYSRVLHQVVPKLRLAVDPNTANASTTNASIFNYLKILFTVTAKQSLHITLQRQPLSKEEQQTTTKTIPSTNTWSPWVLFDNRVWFRARSTPPANVTILAYNKAKHRKVLLETHPKWTNYINSLCHGAVVFNVDGVLHLHQTRGGIECVLKDNVYGWER